MTKLGFLASLSVHHCRQEYILYNHRSECHNTGIVGCCGSSLDRAVVYKATSDRFDSQSLPRYILRCLDKTLKPHSSALKHLDNYWMGYNLCQHLSLPLEPPFSIFIRFLQGFYIFSGIAATLCVSPDGFIKNVVLR